MAIGTTTAILMGIGAGVAGGVASKSFFGSKGIGQVISQSLPQPLPQPPSVEATSDKASETIRKKKAAVTQSVYTSPLGVAGEASVVRKTLLGQ